MLFNVLHTFYNTVLHSSSYFAQSVYSVPILLLTKILVRSRSLLIIAITTNYKKATMHNENYGRHNNIMHRKRKLCLANRFSGWVTYLHNT